MIYSIDSNFEKTFEVTAVFIDPDLPTQHNGGCDTAKVLRECTIQNFFQGKTPLVSRSINAVLRDYEEQNLLKTFPLQFPYGAGGLDITGDERRGISYYKYLQGLLTQTRLINSAYYKFSDM